MAEDESHKNPRLVDSSIVTDANGYVLLKGIIVHTHSLDLPATKEDLREFLEGNNCPLCRKQREEDNKHGV